VRIALIDIGDSSGQGEYPALMPLAGRSPARRQIDLALSLGCERIVCLADGLPPRLIALQHVVERRGARFHTVRDGRSLAALVSASDELLVLDARVMFEPAVVRDALQGRPAVLLLPAESAVPAGFERVDAEHAWAGAMLMRGSAVEQLAQLPVDTAPLSALLRIALQRRTFTQVLPADVLASGALTRFSDTGHRAEVERRLISVAIPRPNWRAPGLSLASRVARRMAAPMLSRDPKGWHLRGWATGFLAAALGVGVWVSTAGGLALLALAAFLAATSQALAPLRSEGAAGRRMEHIGFLARDGAAILLLFLPHRFDPLLALFAPAMLFGLLHLAPALLPPAWIGTARDRPLLFTLLAMAAALSWLDEGVILFALALLAAMLVSSRGASITRA